MNKIVISLLFLFTTLPLNAATDECLKAKEPAEGNHLRQGKVVNKAGQWIFVAEALEGRIKNEFEITDAIHPIGPLNKKPQLFELQKRTLPGEIVYGHESPDSQLVCLSLPESEVSK